VRDLLNKGFERAQEILRTRRADLDAGVQLLLKRETVTVDDFPAIRSAKVAELRLTVVPAQRANPMPVELSPVEADRD
jgi:cell division protease FtsH